LGLIQRQVACGEKFSELIKQKDEEYDERDHLKR